MSTKHAIKKVIRLLYKKAQSALCIKYEDVDLSMRGLFNYTFEDK